MKLQFDKQQQYQLEAIQSVIELFKGQSLKDSDFEISFSDNQKGSLQFTETGIANNLSLTEEQLLENLKNIQSANHLEISTDIEKLSYSEEIDIKGVITNKPEVSTFPNYSIEMETGTGKTYVYLRTIYELNKVYGFKKFIIVVPSVAIREGVLKSLDITFDHLQEIYNKQPLEYKMYDSGRLNELGNFARSNAIQIMVINVDSFTKDANVINQIRETGIKPLEYIQKSTPIVIIDEPQNMETNIRKKAICNLNPLFTLRYSATHKNLYNLVYKLDPIKAYDLGLVKQIEVDSVTTEDDSSGAFISVDGFKLAKKSLAVKLTIFVNEKGSVSKKQVIAKNGDDLYTLSKGWDVYKEGFEINNIDSDDEFIEFSSGKIVHYGKAVGGLTEHILKEMIDVTVGNHFKKEKKLRSEGIKVLSIFFIDRVANYRSYDEQGNAIPGKFAIWFEESFNKWNKKAEYENLFSYATEDVHNGYFSQDKGKLKDSKEGKSTKLDDDTFKLIMRDKEKLLDINTPLRFIFSHSALREGWDNPNVFQICTLNETKSDIKKRQEIGRGLRLCVNQNGERILERAVNRLTVIANEAYDSFSKALQKEIEEDCGVKFEGRIKNARERVQVKLKDKWLEDTLFIELWNKINQKTDYKVDYKTETLIENCVTELKKITIDKPVIYREKNEITFEENNEGNVELIPKLTNSGRKTIDNMQYEIPDFVAYIQSKTELTRYTITQIILNSEKKGQVFNNPQVFMDKLVSVIKQEFDKIKINGIKYEKIAGQVYEMTLFASGEIEQYLENVIEVKKQNKTLYNYITIDSLSTPEKEFATHCDTLENVLFYVKLPRTFKIKTPIGPYNPDWALIKKENDEETHIYFVAETKDKKAVENDTLLRDSERRKIACAKKHFATMTDVHYQVIGSVTELKEPEKPQTKP